MFGQNTQKTRGRFFCLVERTSPHPSGTCPLCAEWERAVLALDAVGEQSPECEGTLAEAEAAGLFHPNCGATPESLIQPWRFPT